MLRKIYVGNFQGFGPNAKAELSPLTLIFGPNSSGKSSLGRAMKVIRQSRGKALEIGAHSFIGDDINMLNGSSVIRGQLKSNRSERELTLGLEVDVTSSPRISKAAQIVTENVSDLGLQTWNLAFYGPGSSALLPSCLNLSRSRRSRLELSADFADFSGLLDLDSENWPPENWEGLLHLICESNVVRFSGNKVMLRHEYQELDDNLCEMLGLSGDDAVATRLLDNLIGEANESIDLTLTSTDFIEPLRPVPPLVEVLGSILGTLIDNSSGPNQQKAQELLSELTMGRYKLEEREDELLDTQVRVRVNQLRDLHTGALLGFDQVGTGLSQVLPIVRSISRDRGTTFIEQPELHLHPRLQGKLMDAFVSAVRTNPDRQFIIETHSETLLLRAQKAVRDGLIQAHDLTILFVDQESSEGSFERNEHGQTNVIQRLNLDSMGDILDPLPVSFASLRLEDLL